MYSSILKTCLTKTMIFFPYKFQVGPDGENHIRVGKLNLVDLAGSERQAKTGATVSTNVKFFQIYHLLSEKVNLESQTLVYKF